MTANRMVLSGIIFVMAGLAACSQQPSATKSAEAEDKPASDISIAPAFGPAWALSAKPARSAQSAATPAFGFKPFRQYQRQDGPLIVVYEAIAAADYTGDGRTDLVARPSSHNQIELFVQRSDGTMAAPLIFPFGGENYFVGSELVTNDFNGDQISDVAFNTVSVNGASGGIGLLLSTRNGAPVFKQGFPDGNGQGSSSWTSLDVDGDGHQDIVQGYSQLVHDDHGECDQVTLRCPSYNVAYGDGRGNFGRQQMFKVAFPGWIKQVESRDLNSDGITDLAMVMVHLNDTTYSGQLMVADRLARGGLAAPRKLYLTPYAPKSLVFGDINGDGLDDTLAGGTEVHLQSVDGSFGPPLAMQTYTMYPPSAVVADFDGDGRKDVISRQFAGFGTIPFIAVYLQRNNSLDAPFFIQDPPVGYGFDVSSHRLAYAAGDMNGDGCNDLVIAAGYDGVMFLDGTNCTRRVIMRPDESRFYRTRPVASSGKARSGKAGSSGSGVRTSS